MTHFPNFLSSELVTHICSPPSIQTAPYCIPLKSYSHPLSNEGVSMIHNNGGKVLYSKYLDFLNLFLHSECLVLMTGGESHHVESLLLALLEF